MLRLAAATLGLVTLLHSARAQIDAAQALHASPTTSDSLGSSIDVDRDTMIVGANGYDPSGKINAGAAVIFRWAGASWVEEARIVASDGVAGDRFGQSVAIQGNTAVVGAYLHSLSGKSGAGAAYVFERTGTTWTQVAKLTAADSAAGDNFGIDVDLDANTVLVGAWFKNGLFAQQGSAYVFTRSNGAWSQQARLTDVGGSASDWFGNSVALEGDTAVVGAPADDLIFSDRGTAHVFTRSGSTWTKRTTLDPGLGGASDFFGQSVSIHNGSIAVGAPGSDISPGGNEGAVYVFTGSGASWPLQQKLSHPAPLPNHSMGSAVAIRGDTVASGLPNFDGIVGTNQGLGITFTRTGTSWAAGEHFSVNEAQAGASLGTSIAMSDEYVAAGASSYSRPGFGFAGASYALRRIDGTPARTMTIAAPAPQTDDNFGNRMASDGTRLVVGAHNEDGGAGTNQGAVYVYRFADESFVLEQKLLPLTPQSNAEFGKAVAVDGTTIIIGAPKEDDGVADAGAAYVFVLSGSTWSQQARLASPEPAAPNQFGYSVAISGNRAIIGSPFDDFVVSATNFLDAGSADSYLRTGTSWSAERKFTESSPTQSDYAGWSVGVDGDSVLVGIPNYDTTASPVQDAGGARFYRWNGTAWITFTAIPGSADNHEFGIAISARNNLFAIGGTNAQNVRNYFWTGTTFQQGNGTVSNASLAGFGMVLSMQPDRLLVGAPNYGGGGAAFLFTRSGNNIGSSPALYVPGATDPGDNLGEAVGMVGGSVFAGGGGISLPGGTNQGAVRRLSTSARVDPFPLNTTDNALFASIGSLFAAASVSDSLRAELSPLARSGGFSFGTTRATFNVPISPFMASIHTATLTDGANLSTSSSGMTLWNRVLIPTGASSTITAGSLLLDLPSTLDLSAGASLTLTPPASTLAGSTTMLPGSTLAAGVIEQTGSFANFGGVVSVSSLNNSATGRISGYGDYTIGVINAGLFDVDADTQIVGNLSNVSGGTITVFNGTLTVLGTLTNNGTIIGDVAGRSALSSERDPRGLYLPRFQDRATQTIYAKGGITMDESARVSPSIGSVLKTAGSFNCGINQNLNFDMLNRTLQLNGRGASSLEAMSTDRGQSLAALNPNLPASFPIGTLRIGPGNPSQPTVVTVVDNRDNNSLGQAACEAVYVENLVIESGSVLNAPSCRVYYKTLSNSGTISTPDNVLRLFGPCLADLNNDGQVDDADFTLFLAQYNILDCAEPAMPAGCSADLNGDGIVEDTDFTIFLAAYNELLCP